MFLPYPEVQSPRLLFVSFLPPPAPQLLQRFVCVLWILVFICFPLESSWIS